MGWLRNNKQMFFDDNCREGKRSLEGSLVKHSLVEAVPPASCPPLKPCGGMLFSPRSQSGHAGAITLSRQRRHLFRVAATNFNADILALS